MKLQSLYEAQDMYMVVHEYRNEMMPLEDHYFWGPFDRAGAERFAALFEKTLTRDEDWADDEDELLIIRLKPAHNLNYRGKRI